MKPIPPFDAGAIVRVPFPYTDRETRRHRPALVVSDGGRGPGAALLWVAMITSAENRRWDDDVAIAEGHREAGLPVPSLIRTAKIATIDAAAAQPLGRLDGERMDEVRAAMARHLG